MGWFKKRSADPEDVERLKAEIAAMGVRLEAADAAKDELDQHVRDITTRLDSTDATNTDLDRHVRDITTRLDSTDATNTDLGQQVRGLITRLETPIAPPPDEPPPAPTVDPAELAEVRDRLDALATRLETVDARITAISTELANQLDEIGKELDAVEPGGAAADAVIEELRDAQTRLANEQARYQIAFRQDLADVADRLRRS